MAEEPRPGDIPDPADSPGTGDAGGGATPPLEESLRAVNDAGRASLGASVDALRAMRGLISADLAMARSAAGRGLAWGGAAVVFGATAWLLATAWVVALLERVGGLSWLSALALATVFNLIITGVAAWRAARFFDYMGLHATRRQLSRLGLFDEHGEDVDGPVPATTPTAAPPAGEPPRPRRRAGTPPGPRHRRGRGPTGSRPGPTRGAHRLRAGPRPASPPAGPAGTARSPRGRRCGRRR